MPHCRVLPPGEFNVMIPVPRAAATLQGAVTWRNQCHDRATLQGVRIPSAIFKIVFSPYFIFCFCFLNAVWALTSGGFRIVSDTRFITLLFFLCPVTDISATVTPSGVNLPDKPSPFLGAVSPGSQIRNFGPKFWSYDREYLENGKSQR